MRFLSSNQSFVIYKAGAKLTTEVMDPQDSKAKWRSGPRLASGLASGCAVKVSPEEILVINQVPGFKSNILYNMTTGAYKQLKAPFWAGVYI